MICKRLLLIAFLMLAGNVPRVRAQAPEDKVKRRQADMLYLVGSLVQSSITQRDKEFIIGTLGDPPPFSGRDANRNRVNHLDAAARASNSRTGKAKRRKVIIRRFKNPDDYEKCHLLFVSREHRKAALEIAKRLKGTSPVLLIGNTQGFAQAGIPLNFYEVQKADGSITVHLELKPTAAGDFGFDKIDPRLITLLKRGLGRIVQ
jgi:hypothetical protein